MTLPSVFATAGGSPQLLGDIGPYNYVPTEWICILFLVLYSISTVLHLGQALKFKLWWMLPTATFAGLLEILGWSARFWSSQNPDLLTPYEMQLVGTIIAPTPLVAANFIILGKIINQVGPQYSRLTPKLYTIIFCCFDVICLIVQAFGGATAARAVSQGTDANDGREYYARRNCRPALSIYRTIELAGGWFGPVITTERYFDWLDGAMVTLAIYTLNFFHPGIWLNKNDPNAHAPQRVADEEASI
ncbi:RTA1 like protein-domain-containing protein [Suillus occidentalis]|nr:RTA1 like protein-domain-containing protein [Suillus occidentalis]